MKMNEIFYDYSLDDYIKSIVLDYFENYCDYNQLMDLSIRKNLFNYISNVYESYCFPNPDFINIPTVELEDSGVYAISSLFEADGEQLCCNVFLHVSYKFIANYLKFHKFSFVCSDKYHITRSNIILDVESDLSSYSVLYKFSGYYDKINYLNYPVIYGHLYKKNSEIMERWVEDMSKSPVFSNNILHLTADEYFHLLTQNIKFKNKFKIHISLNDYYLKNIHLLLDSKPDLGNVIVEVSFNGNDIVINKN